jgi:selenocysteine lyase/cysteine desulfurase
MHARWRTIDGGARVNAKKRLLPDIHTFCKMVSMVNEDGRRVKITMLNTVLTFPVVTMPWEALVKACKDMEILNLIDGAHGIGHIDLAHLGRVGSDFFTSNSFK